MKKNKNTFLGSLSVVIFIAVFFYFLLNKASKDVSQITEQKPETRTQKDSQRTPSSIIISNKTNEDKADKTKLTTKIISFVPTSAPSALKNRWSHVINSEDDLYLDTQLNLDDVPIETYNYRWKKDSSGEASELVAGILPQIKTVNGSFPSQEQSIRLAEDVVNREGDLLSVKEVWSLSSNKVLTPQLKVEVQVKSRTQDSAGHEFWYISVNTGKVVKRTEADRF